MRLESWAMDSASEAGITNLGLSIFVGAGDSLPWDWD